MARSSAASRVGTLGGASVLVAIAVLALAIAPRMSRADELATALYVRADSDDTTVVTPRVRGAKTLGEATTLEATYAVDVWTSASIDIRTSASVHAVSEQRDELDVGLTHELEDVSLHAGYRLSIENDYDSNGLTASGTYDFADNAANVALSVTAIHDVVGRSGDPELARGLDTLNSRLAFTQVLDPDSYVQLTYEIALASGYQASPYRYVGIGGTGLGCRGALECLPERVPTERVRHAFVIAARRAFGDVLSAGLSYRYYVDDWALQSHTGLADVGFTFGTATLIALRYRFYTQGQVEFYHARYATTAARYITRDRELSPMQSHRLALGLEHELEVGTAGRTLALALELAGSTFAYDDFIGLASTQAVEATAALILHL
jgi:hypothetical protein